jgi:transposase-like protein
MVQMVHREERPPLTPEDVFCPNLDCHARGHTNRGNIRVHHQKERRFLCTECEKTFSETKGTLFYRLRKSGDLITLVVTLIAYGCPLQAIVAAFGFDERTVKSWVNKSGRHCQQVHQDLVERPREVGQVQCDELRVKIQGAVIWMAMAIMVSTRLWLGGEVCVSRDSELIEKLILHVKHSAAALAGAILFCTDGLASYPKAILKVFREKEPRSSGGRCCLIEWPNLLIAQLIKQYEEGRVTGLTRHIYQGTKEAVASVINSTQGQGDINTAFIERLNGTFRSRLGSLVRRSRSLARQSQTLHYGMYLVGCVYNFCTEHQSLRLPGLVGGHKWLKRTPAMASGITDHCWSVDELLVYKVPPPRWKPPRQRGRPSDALKLKIAKWG